MHITSFAKITLLLLSIATMMSNVAIITSLPHLKTIFSDVKDIELYSRLMITLPSLSIAILSPFLGHFLQNYKRKNSIVIALVLFSLFGSAGLYLGAIENLLISRLLLGVSIAMLMILTTSLVGDYFQGEARHKYMGLQSAFSSLGGMLFLVGGGLLSDMGWRYPFAIYLIGIIFIPMVLLFLIEPNFEHINEEEEVNLKLTSIYFLGFFLMLIFYTLPTQVPFLIINHFHASGTLTGAIISTAFIANAFGALSFAKFKKRYEFQTIYLIGLGIISIGFVLIGFVRDIHLFFFTSPIMGFGGGLMMTNVMAWMLSRSHHSKRVKSSGYMSSALFLGQFFSPIVFHPLVSYFYIQDFFIVIGCVLLLGVIGIGTYKKISV
ncbi:MFS transporter [Sulfurimonas sp.]|uniref:MFS transporter n=1 Tax=Sulfurimonas sp. TaxID=2022749 RepID=UPI003D127FA9